MSPSTQDSVSLADLVKYLDTYLDVATVADAPEALNGLQVENAGRVTKIAAAVDACEATITMAVAQHADLLLVHHGLFWSGLGPLAGPAFRRMAALVRGGVALYSSHLPLDRHSHVGNAPVLARQLGIAVRGEFGMYKGQTVGVWGELDATRDEFAGRVAQALGTAPRVMAFGPDRVRRIGIITGAGASAIREAADAALDTFLTGEGPHWSYFDAEELHVNVLLAGHYATETVGVKALAEHLQKKFDLPWVFLDHPTGL
jgi:dinuclear metal center YbgI/SA1388 family protein